MQLDNLNIGQRPILILSPPRCGSTALLRKLALLYNLIEFSEPHKTTNPYALKQVQGLLTTNAHNFIIKVMAVVWQSYNFDLNRFYSIRLHRINVIEQIVSFYIARQRGKWHYNSYDNICDPIKIQHQDITAAIKGILFANKKNQSVNFKFDLELDYDDLNLTETGFIKSPRPSNYLELKDAVIRLL